MRLVFALLLFSSSAFASGIAINATPGNRCGLSPAFRATDCGQRGAQAAPSSPTAISTFPQTLNVAGNYQLTADCNTPPVTCLTINNAVVLDFNGHAIHGRIQSSFGAANSELYNGTFDCNVPYATAPDCLFIGDTVGTAKTLKIHDLTGSNTASCTGDGSTWMHFDWTGPVTVQLYNLTGTANCGVAASRVVIIYAIGGDASGASYEIFNNDLSCFAGTATCQTVQYFGAHGRFHNNYIHNPINTSGGDTARAVIFDTSTATSEADHNDIDTNNNRAFRVRNVSGAGVVNFHHNRVDNISSSGTSVAAIHLGDPDAGDNLNQTVNVYNNTLRMTSTGIAVMARQETGAVVLNNTVQCIGSCAAGTGSFIFLRNPIAGGANSILTAENNDGVAGIGFTNENLVGETGGTGTITLNRCNSGAATLVSIGTSPTITCP